MALVALVAPNSGAINQPRCGRCQIALPGAVVPPSGARHRTAAVFMRNATCQLGWPTSTGATLKPLRWKVN